MIQIILEEKINKGFMSKIDKRISVINIDSIASSSEPHISLLILQSTLNKKKVF